VGQTTAVSGIEPSDRQASDDLTVINVQPGQGSEHKYPLFKTSDTLAILAGGIGAGVAQSILADEKGLALIDNASGTCSMEIPVQTQGHLGGTLGVAQNGGEGCHARLAVG